MISMYDSVMNVDYMARKCFHAGSFRQVTWVKTRNPNHMGSVHYKPCTLFCDPSIELESNDLKWHSLATLEQSNEIFQEFCCNWC